MSTAAETTSAKQSRTGKRPIAVPSGVTLSVAGNTVSLKGPKGSLSRELPDGIKVEQKGAEIVVSSKGTGLKTGAQYQGLTRALVANMVEGVAKGYATSMDLVGVGYRAEVAGQNLTLALGLSHQVKMALPKEIQAKVETIDEGGTKKPRLHLTSLDKELLGRIAAHIRSFRAPEPYKGKGVRYTGEAVRQKAGKAGAKGKK